MAKKLLLWAVCLALLVGFPLTASAEEPLDELSARAAVLIEAATGEILYAKNAEEPLPMASTTKIMTALLTLEQPELDTYFTVDSGAIQVEGSSMGLQEGDRVSLRALAYGMLLPSGNDAANAAAVRIAGTTEAFVERMNERAKELGLEKTHFVTPSGLDAEGHGSTALDMAFLARAALRNPDFAAICCQKNAQLEYGNPPYKRWLKNSNKMLSNYEGTIGVKTGFTDQAGRCLVTAARRDGVTLISVTLHDPNDWQDTASLLDYGFSKVTASVIPPETVGVRMATVVGGEREELPVRPYGEATTTVPAEKLEAVVYLDRFYYAPVSAGTLLGRVDYCYEGNVIASLPLMATEDVARVEPLHEKGGGRLFGSLDRAWRAILAWFDHFGK